MHFRHFFDALLALHIGSKTAANFILTLFVYVQRLTFYCLSLFDCHFVNFCFKHISLCQNLALHYTTTILVSKKIANVSSIYYIRVVKVLHSCRPLFKIVQACGAEPARNCSQSWRSLKKKVFT